MKKYILAFVITLQILVPTLTYATFFSESIVNAGLCLYITTGAGNGHIEYITSPSPFPDTDWTRNGFTTTGVLSDCSDTGITNGATGGIFNFDSVVTDGSYTFTGASSGSSTFYVCEGLWSFTECEEPPPPSDDNLIITFYNDFYEALAYIGTILIILLYFFLFMTRVAKKV